MIVRFLWDELVTVTVKKLTFYRKTVCFGLYIDKTCVPDLFSESPLNTDTRIIRTVCMACPLGVLINRVPL